VTGYIPDWHGLVDIRVRTQWNHPKYMLKYALYLENALLLTLILFVGITASHPRTSLGEFF
jgi:hypothetical protein